MSDLTARSGKILGILLEMEGYTPISRIADQLGVSTRTVIRELKAVEAWLENFDAGLLTKPGQGIMLNSESPGYKKVSEAIRIPATEGIFSPRERRAYLMIELLNAREPQKLYCFTSVLNVSEGTISNDLDKIEPIIKGWNLQLVRKPGFGIEIRGDEKQFRTAISNLIFEHFSREELLDIIRKKYRANIPNQAMTSVRNRLLNTIGNDILDGIEKAIEQTEAMKDHSIADSSYVGLVVHMALAVKRLINGEKIAFDSKILEELRESREYDVAKAIVDETAKIFNIHIPEDETGYITMHLKGVKYGSTIKDNGKIQVNDYRIIHLADELIRSIEQDTGYLLQNNNKLLIGLVNHLGPALARIQLGLEIENPLLDEIRTRYTDYYDMTARSIGLLEEKLGLTVPEDEIGYLAMHFGAALEEQSHAEERIYRVVIVCSTGIGSSKLLEARIRKHYDRVRILESCSVMDLEEYLKDRSDVDFVISTVAVKGLRIPVAVVSPLLLEQDMERIQRTMKTFSGSPYIRKNHRLEIGALDKKLELLGQLTDAVRQLLSRFKVISVRADSKDVLISETVNALFAETQRNMVRLALTGRELVGTTVFDDGRGVLLHCRCDEIEAPVLGIAAIEGKPYASEGYDALMYAVVMIAPERMSEPLRTVFGEVSRNLVENPQWTKVLQEGRESAIRSQLEAILKQLIRRNYISLEE